MGSIGCTETSVTNYRSTLCNIPEKRRSHLQYSRSLKLLTIADVGNDVCGFVDCLELTAEGFRPWFLNVSGRYCWRSRAVIPESLVPWLLNVSGRDSWKSRAVIIECLGTWFLKVSCRDYWMSRAVIPESIVPWLLKVLGCDCWTSRTVTADAPLYRLPAFPALVFREINLRVRAVKLNNTISKRRRNNV